VNVVEHIQSPFVKGAGALYSVALTSE